MSKKTRPIKKRPIKKRKVLIAVLVLSVAAYLAYPYIADSLPVIDTTIDTTVEEQPASSAQPTLPVIKNKSPLESIRSKKATIVADLTAMEEETQAEINEKQAELDKLVVKLEEIRDEKLSLQ